MTDPDAHIRRLHQQALAAGELTGWFEPLYAQAASGDATVPWDREAPNAYLVAWAEHRGLTGQGRSAVVVGCGYGRDAEYLAELEFEVTGFDLSPTAIEQARLRHPASSVRYVAADLLSLPDTWRGGFGFVLESHTVQSLPDSLRPAAIDGVRSLVAPGGTLVVFAAGRDEDEPEPVGPPWPLLRREIDAFGGAELAPADITSYRGEDGILRWRAEFRAPRGA